jgi:CubicO group peptidase (beta-lactamase class C family)
MKRIFGYWLLCACYATQAESQPAFDSADASIKKFMKAENVPGFATSVVKDGKVIWSRAYGQSDIDKKKAMSIDGTMNIGSISKTFTATAAMQLWEKGLIDLNADINSYIGFSIRNPNYPDKPITVFQILTHTSSIIDGKAYVESYDCGDPALSLDDWIRGILVQDGTFYNGGDSFSGSAPGEKHAYSNVAFGLLGLIVEKLSGEPFNIYCRKYIFQPLGMKHTGWMLREVDTSRYITPYVYITDENRSFFLTVTRLFPGESAFKPNSYVPTCLYGYPNYTDGLVRTSVRELTYYLMALLNGGKLNGKRILKKATLDKMWTLQLAGNNSQGLTWRTSEFETPSGKVALWGHSGLDPGIQTFLYFNPANKTGVITFENNPADGITNIVGKLYWAATSTH